MEAITVATSSSSSVSSGDPSIHHSDLDVPLPVSVVHVSIPNQPVAVQSLIQGQPSVIQTASGQTIQAIQVQVGDGDGLGGATLSAAEDEESRRRRELLARRPSYRKILNDLSGEPNNLAVTKIEEEDSNSSQASHDEDVAAAAAAADGTLVPIQLSDGAGGLQTLTMTNVATTTAATAGGAPTVLQYAAQGSDGQFFIPAGNIQYQIAPATSLGQSVVMAATTGAAVTGTTGLAEEASRKRELRLLKNSSGYSKQATALASQQLKLLKNREAARECRRKKKDYIKCLENRVALLENQNKTLIEELKSLKELYCQKDVQ